MIHSEDNKIFSFIGIIIMRQLKFSGHQTFSLRYGWLEKGYAFLRSGGCFSKPDSIIDLGVGKNMVSSIEYWTRLANIISPDGTISDFANFILNEDTGRDPYMESDASWWLIHWHIATNPSYLTTASVLFSGLRRTEFSKSEISDYIIKKHLPVSGRSVSPKILERDIDCYLRCYYSRRGNKESSDGSFECPLQELHLIESLPSDASIYRFNIGPKHTLPAHIIGYALWDMLHNAKRNSIRLQEALYGEYSPGQVFMIDENTLVDAVYTLREYPQYNTVFDLSESAGIARIRCDLQNGFDLLNDYYKGGE